MHGARPVTGRVPLRGAAQARRRPDRLQHGAAFVQVQRKTTEFA
ncbi:MAG: hypothetical protein V9G29_20425 [Burkholderiaceae bacterium]